MLNPLRHLKGKLNHIRLPQTQFMRVVEIANCIEGKGQSLAGDAGVTVESIEALKSEGGQLDERAFHRFEFEYMVHSQQGAFGLPSVVFDQLSPYERKVAHTITNYAGRLNTRQQLYLNLALRQKMSNQYPDWRRLHLTPESTFKVEMQVMPSLSAGCRIAELKCLLKKGVMSEAIRAKGE